MKSFLFAYFIISLSFYASISMPGTVFQPHVPNDESLENGHEWVDLGLSVKWATCNVGAVLPGDYGDYFAWGETSKKSEYSWETYRWTDKEFYELIKYCPSDKYDYWVDSGNPDNITQLDMSDDAARQNWGGRWRIPTEKEWTELCEKCDWTWSAQDGHEGYRVSSKKTALTMDGMLNSIQKGLMSLSVADSMVYLFVP